MHSQTGHTSPFANQPDSLAGQNNSTTFDIHFSTSDSLMRPIPAHTGTYHSSDYYAFELLLITDCDALHFLTSLACNITYTQLRSHSVSVRYKSDL